MKPTITSITVVLALLLAVPASALAQLGKPAPPTATRPVTLPQPAPRAPTQAAPQPAPMVAPLPPPKIPTVTPARPVTHPQPIPDKGPAQPQALPTPQAPTRVYDRQGRVMNGMKPVGPNRVMDTRTGRYYDTMPTGDGQQVRP